AQFQLENPKSYSNQNKRLQGAFLNDNGSDEGNYYFGATPINSSDKPVLVFVHGYNTRASFWWLISDMYSYVYEAGYRSAYVSLAPDKDMWHNGELLAGMIDNIRDHYEVTQVILIGHSKGGVDADAALHHFGAWPYVEKTITLSSPHFGTGLADLAHSNYTWWLAAALGQYNDATGCLQTGSMADFRNRTDYSPSNEDSDFRTLGAWDYSGIFLIPGLFLSATSGGIDTGGNDGIVPYFSSKRPNSEVVLGGYGDPRSKLDHLEVAYGRHVWQFIEEEIKEPASTQKVLSSEDANYYPLSAISSQAQIISSAEGFKTFKLSREKNAHLEIHQQQNISSLKVKTPDNKFLTIEEKDIISNPGLGTYQINFDFEDALAGEYEIQSSYPFLGILTHDNGIKATLHTGLNSDKKVYQSGEPISLKLSLNDANNHFLDDALVTAVLNQTQSLGNNNSSPTISSVLNFNKKEGYYESVIKDWLPEGVYNLTLEAVHEKGERSVVTSFAVVGSESNLLKERESNIVLEPPFPNPIRRKTTLKFHLREAGTYQLQIYDMAGRLVKTWEAREYQTGSHQTEWHVQQNLTKGVYFIELSGNGQKATQKCIID
ncbi:T9SS type A sorting domain-containing protein, partial [Xanthovirga aplysinae]|uniref:T9SS type A sorting domain-containing protein n=1 Tax=Xanthovirga aplysinae TaxID=2529853 RepID=UPI0012BD42F4